jgi:Na+/proline symporter
MPEGSLAAVDILIVAVYFVAVLVVGIRMGRGERDTEGFVLGNRRVPWPVVLARIVATEICAATFVAVPRRASSAT